MEFMTVVARFFQDGGAFMYPIVVMLVLGLAIAIERTLYLRTTRVSNRKIWEAVAPLVSQGRYDAALAQTEESNGALARVLSYGLARIKTASRREDLEMAMEESMMEVLPQLERRTPFLQVFANVATLLGLLGTIIGLIHGFSAVANANPAEKANMLSASISVAMNTTAFGLMCAIPLLLIHAWLQAKTTEMVDTLEMTTVKFLNQFTEIRNAAGNPTKPTPQAAAQQPQQV
ncbi:MAG: MotA/TolQ/ExbB proton channel family protein [Oceanococcus sp.]